MIIIYAYDIIIFIIAYKIFFFSIFIPTTIYQINIIDVIDCLIFPY